MKELIVSKKKKKQNWSNGLNLDNPIQVGLSFLNPVLLKFARIVYFRRVEDIENRKYHVLKNTEIKATSPINWLMSTLTEGKYRFFTIFVERSTLFQTNDKLCLRFFRSLLLLLSYSTQNLVKFYSFIYYLFIYLLIYLFIYLFIYLVILYLQKLTIII